MELEENLCHTIAHMEQTAPLFDESFQKRQQARYDLRSAHSLYIEAMKRLEERVTDLSQKPRTPVLSCLELQEQNNLPERLAQIYKNMVKGSPFFAVLVGGQSLFELRQSLMLAEIEIRGGASPRTAPMIDLQTASRLLPLAGFALPVADHDKIRLVYPDLWSLLRDLRHNGHANALCERSRLFTSKALFTKADALYSQNYPAPHGKGIAVTIDLIFLHGWKE